MDGCGLGGMFGGASGWAGLTTSLSSSNGFPDSSVVFSAGKVWVESVALEGVGPSSSKGFPSPSLYPSSAKGLPGLSHTDIVEPFSFTRIECPYA